MHFLVTVVSVCVVPQAGIRDSLHLVGVVSCQFHLPIGGSCACTSRADTGATDIRSHLRCCSQHDDVGANVQSPNLVPATPERRESISSRLPAQNC